MKHDASRAVSFRGLYATAMAGLLFVTSTSFAQTETETGDDADLSATEEIIVTGSRLKRDTYTSISPLQVITSEVSREVGLIDAGEILQDSTAASGQQIETFGRLLAGQPDELIGFEQSMLKIEDPYFAATSTNPRATRESPPCWLQGGGRGCTLTRAPGARKLHVKRLFRVA